MSDVVNLRAARKLRDRLKKSVQATENAARTGRTKAERLAEERAAAKASRTLDGHLRT